MGRGPDRHRREGVPCRPDGWRQAEDHPASRAGRRSARERGFTLLEVLVAFIIAAFALGILFQGSVGGLAATTTALRYEEALSRAQSHLAAATLSGQLTPSDRQGDEGHGYHWRVRVTQLGRGAPAAPGKPVAALYAVAVDISWQAGNGTRNVVLQTQAAGTAPP